jgi:fumarate hydratase class I
MATPVFSYQDPFPLGPDETEYRLLSQEGVSIDDVRGSAKS